MKKKIAKYLKIGTIVFVSTAAIILSGASLLFYFYPEESLLNIIKTKSETALGRKVEIKSLRYSIRGVILQGVKISDLDENNNILPDDKSLLEAQEALIQFSLLSLLRKEYTINTLYFKDLSIRWSFDNSGKSNIERIFESFKKKSSEEEQSKTSIKINEIILTDCSLNLVNPPSDFKPLEGVYIVNGKLRLKKDNIFHLSETGIELPAGRGKLFPDISIDLTEKLKFTGIIKLENCSLNWVYGFAKKKLKLPFETVNGIVDNFELQLPSVKGHAKVTSTLSRSKSIIHADGSCTVDITNKTVVIKDVKNRINNSSSVLDDLFISANAGEVRRFSVSNLNYSISDLRQLENSIPSGFSGNLKGNLSYNGAKFNGRMQISECSYKDRTEVFSGLNTEIELINNIFKKESVPVKIFGSNFNVSLAATDSNFKSIYVFIKGDKLDVNNISLSGGKSSSDFSFPINISGKIQVGEIIYDKFLFKNNHADFVATGKTIKLNRVDTSLLSGSLNGSGKIDLSGDFPTAHINARFNGMKVNDLKFANDNLNNRLFGFADGAVNLNFGFRENMTETLKGNATFSVSKGKVVNTGIQNGLIIFLAELRYKLKDLEFNKIYGNIDVNGRDLTINSFIFNSEDIRLSMNGRINSDLTANNMTVKLEFNNHFIKDIPRPAIAFYNEYLSGRWYTIPFLLNGNITDSKNIKMLKKN
ncbi:MAG TPA: AsmA-like C-terminal region-containing protein [Spirochaetota bacterium]|nr:AsmA-like C-terminal region-containing protein [Spirochaetota bacterium]HPR36111.1 AsmA-like C-terminal region-containing protein [Spirochaetota bacterium]HRX48072.1 AsmA-like C-terminal region-containing protein [Spirochaetota bacterium]